MRPSKTRPEGRGRRAALLISVCLSAAAVVGLREIRASAAPLPSFSSLGDGLVTLDRGLASARTRIAVRAALRENRVVAPFPIGVEAADDGVVILRGAVPDPTARSVAVGVAAAAPGVKRVVDELRVDSGVARPLLGRTVGTIMDDAALELRARLAFCLRSDLEGSRIGLHAYDRTLILSGSIAREEQRQTALRVARDVPGAVGVMDALDMDGSNAAVRASASVAEREAAARRALSETPQLARYGLKVRVEDGRAVVTGTVSEPMEKDLAELVVRIAFGPVVENAVEIGS
jgi:osmotically-inducible protein OsmY